ncbi:MAG: hypothetical protein MHM6MM_005528 [Cercozoa sp. M6MM]
MSSRGVFDRYNIFSPSGQLFQVEYAFKAVKHSALTSVGVRGKDCVVMVTQKKVPDKLLDPASVTNMFRITRRVGSCVTGSNPDAQLQTLLLQQRAAEFRQQNGYGIPVDHLASKLGDFQQYFTQTMYMRLPAVVNMLAGMDDEKGPLLYKVDPAGHFVGYHATAAGAKEQEASNFLEKQLKERGDEHTPGGALSFDDAMATAILCLQHVVGSDLKPTDFEVLVCTADEPEVKILSVDDIDQRLQMLSDAMD